MARVQFKLLLGLAVYDPASMEAAAGCFGYLINTVPELLQCRGSASMFLS